MFSYFKDDEQGTQEVYCLRNLQRDRRLKVGGFKEFKQFKDGNTCCCCVLCLGVGFFKSEKITLSSVHLPEQSYSAGKHTFK